MFSEPSRACKRLDYGWKVGLPAGICLLRTQVPSRSRATRASLTFRRFDCNGVDLAARSLEWSGELLSKRVDRANTNQQDKRNQHCILDGGRAVASVQEIAQSFYRASHLPTPRTP